MAKELKTIKMDLIMVDEEFNSRDEISPVSVVELAKSIESNGLLQPVSVCPIPSDFPNPDAKVYMLFMGFRRFMAHKVLQKDEIECMVDASVSGQQDALIRNLHENLSRENLSFLEEAHAMKRLKMLGLSRTDAAKEIGKSPGWVQIRFMLLDLPPDIQQEVNAGAITQTQVRELHTIMIRFGHGELYKAARTLKDQKILGRKNVSVNPDKVAIKKRYRNRAEIFNMIDHILQSKIGGGLHTKVLAWAAGEIDDKELYVALAVHAKENSIEYKIPVEAFA